MRAVILIHGFLTNVDDFKNLVPSLDELYDLVYLYEVPGHSIPPQYKYFNTKDTFKTLLEVYDKISLEYSEIDCVGFSMGGALATYLQSVRKINNLVLLAPANKYLNFKIFRNRIKLINSLKQAIKVNKGKDETISTYKEKLKAIEKDDKISQEMAFKMLFPHYSIHNLSTFRTIVKKCNEEIISINCPCLIIWGRLDQLVPYESVKELYDICVNNKKKLVVYDDISHLMLNSYNHQKIVDEIVLFLGACKNE